MSYPLDNNKTVLDMWQMNLEGNIIPHSWYKTIIKTHTARGKPLKTSRAYHDAIIILADIVWWYRPQEIRDEKTGAVIELRKKFKADKLQRSYDQMAKLFGMTKEQARNACKYLVEKQLIELNFRHSKIASNQLYIGLNVDYLRKFTYIIPVNLQGDTRKITQTYTEMSPEDSTETSSEEELPERHPIVIAWEDEIIKRPITVPENRLLLQMYTDWENHISALKATDPVANITPLEAVVTVLKLAVSQTAQYPAKYANSCLQKKIENGWDYEPGKNGRPKTQVDIEVDSLPTVDQLKEQERAR